MSSARTTEAVLKMPAPHGVRRCHFCEAGGVLGLCLVRQTSIWFCGSCREQLEALVNPGATRSAGR